MERVKGSVKLSGNHQQILVQVTGRPNEWRTGKAGNGGRLFVKVAVDLAKQSWDVRVKSCKVFAPVRTAISDSCLFSFGLEVVFSSLTSSLSHV